MSLYPEHVACGESDFEGCALFPRKSRHSLPGSICFSCCDPPIRSDRWTFWRTPAEKLSDRSQSNTCPAHTNAQGSDCLEARWTEWERWEGKVLIIEFDMFCHHLSAQCLSGFGGDDKAGRVMKEACCLITRDTWVGRRAHTLFHTHN